MSSNQAVNFHELVQFMTVCADAKAYMEQRHQKEREEMVDNDTMNASSQMRGAGIGKNRLKIGGRRG